MTRYVCSACGAATNEAEAYRLVFVCPTCARGLLVACADGAAPAAVAPADPEPPEAADPPAPIGPASPAAWPIPETAPEPGGAPSRAAWMIEDLDADSGAAPLLSMVGPREAPDASRNGAPPRIRSRDLTDAPARVVGPADAPPRQAPVVAVRTTRERGDFPPRQEAVPPETPPAAPIPEIGSRALIAVDVLPPLNNVVDVTAMEQLAGAFHTLAGDVALEVSGDATQRRLSVRGSPAAVRQVIDQLHHVYPDLETRPLAADADPARRLPAAAAQTALALRPGRAAFLSLKTWREFEGNDPLTPILAALADLAPGECGLAQVIVHGAAQANWADRHLRDLNLLRRRAPGGQGAPDLRALLIAILTFALMIAGFATLMALYFYAAAWWHWALGIPAALALLGGGITLAAQRNEWATALEAEAEIKLREQAFRTSLRIYAGAATPERAAAIADRLSRAYQLFNTTSGNHLAIAPAGKGVDPQRLVADKGGDATLSVREVAGLWHIPVGAHHDQLERALFQRLLPLPAQVTWPAGQRIGMARKGPYQVPVDLSPLALRRNALIVGKPQHGKTTLLELMATWCFKDPTRCTVVLDPHGDMAERLIGLIPPERARSTILIDAADLTRVVGLNLLDVQAGLSTDEISETFVNVGRSLWKEYWGPRMLIPLVNGLQALAEANLRRAPERQYTLLSLWPLLNCRGEARAEFLRREVPAETRPELHRYFLGAYDALSPSLRETVISPVNSKMQAFERAAFMRRLVGQPRSTVHLAEAIRSRAIVIVNLNAARLGNDLAGFLGSFILNVIRNVILAQGQMARGERVQVTAIADEAQLFDGIDYADYTATLLKFGGNLILGTQSLANLRRMAGSSESGRESVDGLLAGLATLVALQLNGDDAQYLVGREFDAEQIRPESLTTLSAFMAYVRTVTDDHRVVPLYSVELARPLDPDPATARLVRGAVSAYTTAVDEADRQARASIQRFEEAYVLGDAQPEVATFGDEARAAMAQLATRPADQAPAPLVVEAGRAPSRPSVRLPGMDIEDVEIQPQLASVASRLKVRAAEGRAATSGAGGNPAATGSHPAAANGASHPTAAHGADVPGPANGNASGAPGESDAHVQGGSRPRRPPERRGPVE